MNKDNTELPKVRQYIPIGPIQEKNIAPAIGGNESNPEFPPKDGILDLLPAMSTCLASQKPREDNMG